MYFPERRSPTRFIERKCKSIKPINLVENKPDWERWVETMEKLFKTLHVSFGSSKKMVIESQAFGALVWWTEWSGGSRMVGRPPGGWRATPNTDLPPQGLPRSLALKGFNFWLAPVS